MSTTALSKNIPRRKAHPLLGQVKAMKANPMDFLYKDALQSKEGISSFKLGPRTIIHLSKPEYIKHVTQLNASNYIKNRGTKILRFGLGNGLLTAEGDFWLKRRRAAQPVFHKKRIAGFVDTMASCTEEMMQGWESRKGTTFDVHHEMMMLTLDIISQTMVSSPKIKEMAPKIGDDVSFLLEHLMKRIQSVLNLPYWMPVNQHPEMKRRRAWLRNLAQGFIDERRAVGNTGNDLLSMLMETTDGISKAEEDDQVIDELLTIFIAGHETTAVAMSYIIFLLAQHPEVYDRLKAETKPLLEHRAATIEDLASLPYTKQVIMESMRLYPPAWLFGRESLEDDEIDGYHIPKGCDIFISPWAMHHHKDYWEEPMKFDPDRFEEEKAKTYNKFVYMPFGGGVRFCIGNNFALMEMQVALATIMSRFDFELKEGFQLELEPLITLRPKNGVGIRLKA